MARRTAGRPVALFLTVLATWASSAGVAGAQATPTLKLTPSAGTVGSTVRAVGLGFCGSAGCSSVQLTFAGIVVADGIQVGSDRRFAITVVVPGGLEPGEQPVAATQTTASGHQRAAMATFQVTSRPPAGSPSASTSASPSGSPSSSPSGSTGPTQVASPPSSASPAAGGGGTSRGVIWAMVGAAAVFLGAVAGVLYILWRSREIRFPMPPGAVRPDQPRPPVLTHAGPPEQAVLESALGEPHGGHLEPGPARPHPGDDESAG